MRLSYKTLATEVVRTESHSFLTFLNFFPIKKHFPIALINLQSYLFLLILVLI